MKPLEEAPSSSVRVRACRLPGSPRPGRSAQSNFGFDASAWDPEAVLAARIEERFQRRVRHRIGEVLELLQQMAPEAGPTPGNQEIQALAFCLVDALIEKSGVPTADRVRLLQMVACHSLLGAQEVGAGESSYWFYLNLMLKRFQQSRAVEGLERTVVDALSGCSPLLETNRQVPRELAAELLELLAAGERSPPWRAGFPKALGPNGNATQFCHPAPGE